jgi:4-amino-4-deoxy-L-arabinose transferase-like glycosyltransferase
VAPAGHAPRPAAPWLYPERSSRQDYRDVHELISQLETGSPGRSALPTSLTLDAMPLARGRAASLPWQRLALGGVLLLAAFLTMFRLDRQGYGNTYYAAAVKSMLLNWHNFFFASFDPAGFVTIDKPPLGYWLQALVARLFGFSGLALLLPQALAAVLAVALLSVLIADYFGKTAGLLAALVLAVTPISVATARDNLVDPLLVLVLLVAAWATLRALEAGSLRWLLLCAVVVGLGFNIKMLQAYLVLPAFAFAYLIGTRLPWRTRVAHLALAGIVLLVVSLSWAVAVDLTPTAQRPYIGSSENNSVLQLALGYNGLLRLLPPSWVPAALISGPGGGGIGAMFSRGMGDYGLGGLFALGPQRLFGPFLAGQIAWLLPLAALGGLVAWWQEPTHLPPSRRQGALVLWGGWFLTAVAFFSVASPFSLFHRYYLVMLAPPLAALAGTGLVALWDDYRRPGWRGWLLPVAVAGTITLHLALLAPYPEWQARLGPPLAVVGLVAALGLAALRADRLGVNWLPALAAAALAAMLTAPTVWAGYSLWHPVSSVLPAAGPGGDLPGALGALAARGTDNAAAAIGIPNLFEGQVDPKLMQFLTAHRGDARYLVAGTSAMSVAPIILASDAPVASLGGFIGGDPVVSIDRLANLVDSGTLRFILAPSAASFADIEAGAAPNGSGHSQSQAPHAANASGLRPGTMAGFVLDDRVRWVNDHCTPVPEAQWQTAPRDERPFGFREVLFDCARATP